jgi:hypothetical protein
MRRVAGDAGEDVSQPSLRIDAIHFARDNEAVHHRSAIAPAIRRGVMMPGVWAARLLSPIHSIRFLGSRRLLSLIKCMAALVI